MKHFIILFTIYFLTLFPSLATSEITQHTQFRPGFSVKTMSSSIGELEYGIEYPKQFDKSQKYPILLCLTGGGFSLKLANYFNKVYTPDTTFKNYIKIYPINNSKNKVLSFSKKDWQAYMMALKNNEYGSDENWVISGASNGGIATFNLISATPQLFRGFIVIPGYIQNQPILEEWQDYTALIVYGSKDTYWVKPSIQTYKKLKKHVSAIELMVLEGEGHVLPSDYDINPIYEKFEELSLLPNL